LICDPGFFEAAVKRLSQTVSLLFATLTGRSISVAAKGVKAIAGSDPDRVVVGQWTAVSEQKNRKKHPEPVWAGVGCREHGVHGDGRGIARHPSPDAQGRTIEVVA